LAVSCATIVRPLDGLCLWIVLSLDLCVSEKVKWKALLAFYLLSVLGAGFILSYNKFLIGQWAISLDGLIWKKEFRYFQFDPRENVGFFSKIHIFLHNYYINLRLFFWPVFKRRFVQYLVCWIPFFALNFFTKFRNSRLKLFSPILLIYSFLLVAFYNVVPSLGWPQYGSRYWYVLIVPMGLFVAEGIRVLYTNSSRYFFATVLALAFLCQIYYSFADFQRYSKRFTFISNIQMDIDAKCPDKSIVILNWPNRLKGKDFEFTGWADFKRNPFLKGSKLYIINRKSLNDIQRNYPDYSVCDYFFPEPFTYNHSIK